MISLTADYLVKQIGLLPRQRPYPYFSDNTGTVILIEGITKPEGPIAIKRYNPSRGQTPNQAKTVSISASMLHRVAAAIRPDVPINIDRILGASYNTRSALETLLGYTPEFSFCFPGRIEINHSTRKVKKGHKHLIWQPNSPHPPGQLNTTEVTVTISEIPNGEAIYEAIALPPMSDQDEAMSPELKRIHAQMQVALIEIGQNLGCRSYVAKNDQGLLVKNQPLATHASVVTDLRNEQLFGSWPEAAKAGALIDCIWLKNAKYMPAVMEVECTTGVTSGLSRMLNFKDNFPDFTTTYIVAAPDDDRAKVIRECQKEQFKKLKPVYLPFSAINELVGLTQKGRLRGVHYDILQNFVEPTIGV